MFNNGCVGVCVWSVSVLVSVSVVWLGVMTNNLLHMCSKFLLALNLMALLLCH